MILSLEKVKTHYWLNLGVLSAAYFAAAMVSARWMAAGTGVSPILPQAGIALAAMILLGRRLWPGVAGGALLAYVVSLADTESSNLAVAGVSLVIAAGCTLEAYTGAYLYERFVGPGSPLRTVKDFVKFFILVAFLSTTISATIALTGLQLGGLVPDGELGRLWLGWWLGGEVSGLIIVPLLLSWAFGSTTGWPLVKVLEAAFFVTVVILVLQLIQYGAAAANPMPPYVGLLIPFFISSLIWLALRYGEQVVTAAIFISWVTALGDTLNGFGSLVKDNVYDSLLNVQASWSALAIVILIPAAAIIEGRKSNINLRLVKDELENRASVLTETNIMLESEIAERKRIERELKRALDELNRSNAELQQFAYVTSHDLQEPLRMITSYVQLLQQRYGGRLDADADDFIGFAVDGASRMQKMIEDLLSYSRVSTNRKPFEITDSEEILKKALANLATMIKESGAEIPYDALPAVEVDSSQMVHLFQNLLSNAIKFHGVDPPQIRVEAQLDDGEWIFCVSDNGIGIKSEQFYRIFEIFQRLHAREEYPGTGIGLAICKKIVEHHGGRIWVESESGAGSTFYFSIPERGVQHP